MKRIVNKEAVRYVVAGFVNTAITYLAYLALLLFFSTSISYLISYIIGILVSFVLNSKIVFKTNMTLWKFIQYPLVYVVQFLLGFGLLHFLISYIGIKKEVAPLIVTIISIPITFAISKLILSGRLGNLLIKK